MSLPSSGTITMGMIRTELKKTGAISLGSAECRELAGKPSGVIKMSDFYGKSSIPWNTQEVVIKCEKWQVSSHLTYVGYDKYKRKGEILKGEDFFGDYIEGQGYGIHFQIIELTSNRMSQGGPDDPDIYTSYITISDESYIGKEPKSLSFDFNGKKFTFDRLVDDGDGYQYRFDDDDSGMFSNFENGQTYTMKVTINFD